MALKIIRPESEERAHLSILVYGLTGVGKTLLCGTANKCEYTSPTLLIDIDGGIITLAGQKIDVVRPKNFKEIQRIYTFLRTENTKYRSVCVDSLTELQRKLSMGEILGELDENAAYRNLATATPPHRQDWLRSHEHMRKFMRAFKDLCYLDDESRRLHVIMTALEKQDEGRELVCPQLPGVLGVECGAFVDVLARLSIQKRARGDKEVLSRHLLTQEYEDDAGLTYLAKNRGGKLGQQLWKPSIDKIISLWMVE